jgi:hypothetical protein
MLNPISGHSMIFAIVRPPRVFLKPRSEILAPQSGDTRFSSKGIPDIALGTSPRGDGP